MEILGHGFYYQDWHEGYEFQTLTRTITETDILNFVGVSGMTEELFTSQEYLETHTDFTGRLVPGALVFSMAEGLVIPATISRTGIAFLNCEIDIKSPTFAGDTIFRASDAASARHAGPGAWRTVLPTWSMRCFQSARCASGC